MPRPAPLALGGQGQKPKAVEAVPEAPEAEVVAAIEQLASGTELDDAAVRGQLGKLQHVSWQHRPKASAEQPRPQWQNIPADDPRAAQMEEQWRSTLWVAITEAEGGELIGVSRRSKLNIAEHPFCSQTGQRHPVLPKDFFQYRRVPLLSERTKQLIKARLVMLVAMARNRHAIPEVAIFVTMVMCELTSPKIQIDDNKAELVKNGVISVLCNLLKEHATIEIICQNVTAVLRNLLTNIPASEQLEKEGHTRQLIACTEAYPMNNELVHRATGCLLIQASRGAESRKALMEAGVVPCMVKVLQTPHGRMHMIRRLVITTFQKLVKTVDKEQFRAQMDSVKGFTLLNHLRGLSNDDDRPGMEEILAMRADLPRGTFVDPTVLVIDERGQFHREAIVQILKSNEARQYTDDPPTPKGRHLVDFSPEQAASPLFPSQPSFGLGDFADDDDQPAGDSPAAVRRAKQQKLLNGVNKARTPGASTPQSSLPDVVLADDDMVFRETSNQITTPVTLGCIQNMYAQATARQSGKAAGASSAADDAALAARLSSTTLSEEQRIARATIELLNARFTPEGVFRREDPEFAKKLYPMLCHLAQEATRIMRLEPTGLVDMPTPCYVFGDIHGNFGDLQYFMKSLTLFDDVLYTPYNFLFLGDYVDRGKWGPECMAYLLAYKILAPESICLLRGNHEDNDVCGDVNLYGEGCFRTQIMQVFAPSAGFEEANKLYDSCIRCFNNFPLCAIIDHKIFCSHGGIPRYTGGEDMRMQSLRDPDFPAFEGFILPSPEQLTQTRLAQDKRMRQWVYAHDCIWSDPSMHGDREDEYGFGRSMRGGQVISYGQMAVDGFLDATGLEFIMRGHEEKADGLNISKQARVLTVFTTSDYCLKGNRGGVALVRKMPNGDLMCRMIHRAKPVGQMSAYGP